ncbi:thioesterase II family protein [Oleidesulfovibrio sp.]|uniref:thioesterase II family protein n=1 Tax=Oleidesulfovibrio sp. TaxID=2909707 RepID=UPI003A86141B
MQINTYTNPSCLPHLPAEPDNIPRMFCFPFAGSSAEYYRQWQPALKEVVRVCPVELPGRASRHHEPLAKDMNGLVTELTDALLPFTGQPYIFFGHSLGSGIASLVIRELHHRGALLPALFFASGRFPIHLKHTRRICHTLSDEDLIDEIRRLGGTPEGVLTDPTFKQFFLPVVRADFQVLETFTPPKPVPLAVPIRVLGGVDDADSPEWSMEHWKELSLCQCSIRMFPGGHFFIDENRDSIFTDIRTQISNVLGIN